MKKFIFGCFFQIIKKEWKNASSRLIDNSYKITQKNRLSRCFFWLKTKKLIPVTRIQINESYQFIFLFEQGKAPLAMKEIFLFLMKNREKAVYYQSKEELIPLYGVKEIENKVVI